MVVRFVVYNIYGMGGTVRTVANTANYLVENGYKVEIISLRKTSEKPLFNLNKNIRLSPLIDLTRKKKSSYLKEGIKNKLNKLPSFLFDRDEDLYSMITLFTDIKLYRKLKRIKSGVLITTIPSLNFVSAKFVDKNVIKIAQEHKSYDVHSNRIQKRINKYYKQLDGITCLTEKDKNDYIKVINDKGVFINRISNATAVQYQKSNLMNKVIVSAGRFSEEKGFDLLIKSFNKAFKSSKSKDWSLKIFGAGKEKDLYVKMIDELDMGSNIKLLPTSSKLIDEIKESSIYALPSRREGFGMVIIESMSVGVPCICFECDGPKEILNNNVDGILIEKENVTQFSNALLELMDNYEKRLEMGTNAKINSQKYSMNILGKQWIKMINELTNRKRSLK